MDLVYEQERDEVELPFIWNHHEITAHGTLTPFGLCFLRGRPLAPQLHWGC